MKKGIDISRHQGSGFDVSKTATGAEFAILKIGGADDGLYEDSQFKNYYKKAKKDGMPIGAYFFGNAKTIDEANAEADYLLELLKGLKFEYPIFYDVEGDMLKNDKYTLTDIIITVLEKLEDNGYFAGIYSSRDHFNSCMIDDELAPYTHWVAFYSDRKPQLKSGNTVDMWQYSSTIKNQNVYVDHNFCYVDYETAIVEGGFNNYKEEPKKTNEEIADEVMKGLWGNNPERRARLIQAGYDADVIQALVDNKYESTRELQIGDEVTLGKVGAKVRDVNGIDCTLWYDTYTVMEVDYDTVVVGVDKVVFSRFYKNQVKKV